MRERNEGKENREKIVLAETKITFPCSSSQRCIASNESSGIDIIVSLIQTELTALDDNQKMAMKLKVSFTHDSINVC